MERTLLMQILERTPGIEKRETEFEVADEHRASIYLGAKGGTTVLSDLVRIALHDAYLEAEAKDRTLHCVMYEPILGLAVKRPRQEATRTGF